MTLLLDIGNSRIKWQWSQHFTDTPGSFSYTPENLFQQLELNLKDFTAPADGVVIASVGRAEINSCVSSWCSERWGVAVKFLGSAVEWQGLRNGYERPETLGVDRWCVLVGAAASYSYPFIVCDIGTALTIDLVDHSGAHLGGYIAPGLEMMMHALNSKTAISMLPHNAGSGGSTIPTNTQMAVREGCMQSLVSLIDSIMRKHAPQSLCILTGGGAEELHALLETKTTVDKNLLFSGMLRQI